MIRSVKKIVSLIAAAGVMSTLTFTSSKVVEAKAANNFSVNESGSYDNGALSIANENDDTDETSSGNYGLCDNTKDGVILHCWSWSCNTIKENMKDIAEAGYSSIQTCPINNIKEQFKTMKLMGSDKDNGTDGAWWWYYQPTDWKIGNYVLGSEDDFKSMCAEAHKYGIKVIVDVVPNHTTGDGNWVSQNLQNVAGGWNDLYHTYYNQPIGNYNDRYECTLKGCSNGGLYDVNTENPAFQAYFVKYLNQCMADGADGFRYDTAKHIGLPDDPTDPKTDSHGWKNNFWPVVTGKDSANGTTVNNNGGKFVYGEVLQDTNVKEREYGDYINIIATRYGSRLDGAVANKNFDKNYLDDYDNPAGASKCVTWVESHDTYTGDISPTRWMNDWQIRMCWAVIAARECGTPLFFNRPAGSNSSCGNTWGNNVLGAKGNDQFKDPEVVAVNKFRNAMVGQHESMINYGSNAVLGINRGNKGEVIINLGEEKKLDGCETKLADGTYTDSVSGGEFKVSGGRFTSGTAMKEKVTVLYENRADVDVYADKDSQKFDGNSIPITLSAKNCKSAYYTINGGEKVNYTDGETINLGSNIKNGESVTLNLYGTGDKGSDSEEYTYTKIIRTYEANTLYSDKVSGWGDMYAYVYKGDGDTATKIHEWPGVKMTYNSSEERYEYKLPAEYQNSDTKVIFTDGSQQVPAPRQPGKEVVNGKAMLFNGSEIVYKDPTIEEIKAGETTTSIQSPQEVGTAIQITAGQATGGSGDYTYKIEVNGDVIKDFNSSKTATWTPSEAGNYNIEVTVRDSKGKEDTDTISYKINPAPVKPVITSFTSDVESAYVGDTVNFKAKATSKGTVKYKFVVKLKGNEVYNSGYTSSNKAAFIPKAEGTYKVTCYVKDNYGEASKNLSVSVYDNPLKITTAKLSTKSPVAGEEVKISAAASGKGTIKYRFVVLKNDSELDYVRGYSKKTNTVWTPKEAGNYTIYVKAKDSTGKEVFKTISCKVKEAEGCKIESVTATAISQKSIRITASAKSQSAVSYKIYVYNFEDNWTLLKNYSTKDTVIWKPAKKGSYCIFVQAKDSKGNIDIKAVTYEVK